MENTDKIIDNSQNIIEHKENMKKTEKNLIDIIKNTKKIKENEIKIQENTVENIKNPEIIIKPKKNNKNEKNIIIDDLDNDSIFIPEDGKTTKKIPPENRRDLKYSHEKQT